MLSYIFGPAGSGKSYEMTGRILASLRNGKRVFLIAPEQEVMLAEGRIAAAAERADISCEELNVVSFRRLADLVFRRYSGLRYTAPTEGARLVIMWQVTEELAPFFKAYTGTRDRAFSELMLSACDELRRSAVTPHILENAADKLSQTDPSLSAKLHDLELIYSGLRARLSGSYTDPADDVTRLYSLLCKNSFFEGSDVYLDSFNGFTSAEFNVISRILRQADNVSFALCLPTPTQKLGFETVLCTLSTLKRLSVDAGISASQINELWLERTDERCPRPLLILERAMRSLTEPLSAIDAAWSDEAPFGYAVTSEGAVSPDFAIRVFSTADEFSEAELAAATVLQHIRNGARYRDIAIVTRGVDRLFGIIEPTLEKYGIPYFISVRRQLSSTPLFKTVSSALRIIDGGWRQSDIMTYLKSGQTPLSIREISLLEGYTELWSISGSSWYSEAEWTMNPDGYTDRLTQEGMEKLEELNRLKEAVTGPLIRLSEAISASPHQSIALRDGCKAIYEFFEHSGINEAYSVTEDKEAVTAYNTFIDMLDMLVHTGGDIPVNARVLRELLDMAADKTDFGAIPQAADCVVVGDAALLRAGSVDHVIVLGCIDGVFPRAVSDDGFFSDAEKQRLSEFGINTSPKTDTMADDELFYFYRAASAASANVTFSYPRQNGNGEEQGPSIAVKRVLSLFGLKEARRYPEDVPLELRAVNSSDIQKLIYSTKNSAERSVLENIAEEYVSGGSLLPKIKLTEPHAAVSRETALSLFGKDIALTQYRLESFSKCRFSYYAKYVLGMDSPKPSEFSAADEGSFIHRVLERAVSQMFDENGLKSDIDEAELKVLLDEVIEEILRGILGKNAVFSARLSALIERLKKRTWLLLLSLIKEFSKSRFVPSYFELKVSDDGVRPFRVELPDGSAIYVYGRIDRVDTFKKGNDVFVRVVDYKSGSTEHSLKQLSKGIDLQLLLYTFALWNTDRRRLTGPLGTDSNSSTSRETVGNILPAGMLYRSAAFPSVTSDAPPSSEEAAIEAGIAKFTSTGFLLNDPDILSAMDSELSGSCIPIKVSSSGEITAVNGSQLKALEEFGELMTETSEILKSIGLAMRSGNADAAPLLSEQPCKFCEYAEFCRNKTV